MTFKLHEDDPYTSLDERTHGLRGLKPTLHINIKQLGLKKIVFVRRGT
jgi:hypothetical protein